MSRLDRPVDQVFSGPFRVSRSIRSRSMPEASQASTPPFSQPRSARSQPEAIVRLSFNRSFTRHEEKAGIFRHQPAQPDREIVSVCIAERTRYVATCVILLASTVNDDRRGL